MKTKALISFVVTAKLICVFVFAYAKSRFSHNAAHLKTIKITMYWYGHGGYLGHVILTIYNAMHDIWRSLKMVWTDGWTDNRLTDERVCLHYQLTSEPSKLLNIHIKLRVIRTGT